MNNVKLSAPRAPSSFAFKSKRQHFFFASFETAVGTAECTKNLEVEQERATGNSDQTVKSVNQC